MNNRGQLFIYYCCKTLCFVYYSLFLVIGIVCPILTWKMDQKIQEMAPVIIPHEKNYHVDVTSYRMVLCILPGLFGLIMTTLGIERTVYWVLWIINFITVCLLIIAVTFLLEASYKSYTDCKEDGLACVCRLSNKFGPLIKFSNSCADVNSLNMFINVLGKAIWVGWSLIFLHFFFHLCFLCGKEKDKGKGTKTPKTRKVDQQRSKPEPTVKCISKPTTGKSDNDKAADENILRGEPNIYVEFPSFPAPRDASGNDESSHIYEELKF